MARRIDAADLAHDDSGVAITPEHRAHRTRDIGRRERRGRDLVEQRLKDMMVGPIDQQDLDATAGERTCCVDAAEPGAYDNDAWPLSA